jgi:hypothetical protein
MVEVGGLGRGVAGDLARETKNLISQCYLLGINEVNGDEARCSAHGGQGPTTRKIGM